MPNTIPPLVCNTPPPIDDLESDEDLSAPNDNYDLDGMINCVFFNNEKSYSIQWGFLSTKKQIHSKWFCICFEFGKFNVNDIMID